MYFKTEHADCTVNGLSGVAGAMFYCSDEGGYESNRHYALSSYLNSSGANDFDAGFGRILMGRQTWAMTMVTQGEYYVAYNESFILCQSSSAQQTVVLPANPANGTVVNISQSSSVGYNVKAQTGDRIDTVGESQQQVSINERGSRYQFVWIGGINYEKEGLTINGMWQCSKMSNAL